MINTTSWHEILGPNDPAFVDGAIDHFGDATAETNRVGSESTKTPLADYSVVRITGEDAIDFYMPNSALTAWRWVKTRRF